MNITIVLLSGGIDSTTALHWAIARGGRVEALTFDYGQRHRLEVGAARRTCRRLSVPWHVLKVDLGQVGGSCLTDPTLPLPEYKNLAGFPDGPPVTYVPFRNGIFLALAAAWAEAHGGREIVCGFNVIDSPNYPDTRKSFVRAMQRAVNQGTGAAWSGRRIRILAPFLDMKKSEIIKTGLRLGADYSSSISCYGGKETPCGRCSACLLRKRAWEEMGSRDHLIIRLEREGRI
ncbi:MAG: 7-cyano-7-deazaguanine synthase QueC [Candidatus Aminicenantes bacterium RBG_13_59_9]|nr:MAG: 7-cyano-7-deazaguanine synthase QueC [Candidatus Aminicenantes bacterium RBG_13_59_9]